MLHAADFYVSACCGRSSGSGRRRPRLSWSFAYGEFLSGDGMCCSHIWNTSYYRVLFEASLIAQKINARLVLVHVAEIGAFTVPAEMVSLGMYTEQVMNAAK